MANSKVKDDKKMIGVYVDDELYNDLQAAAQAIGIYSVSTYIRVKMVETLNNQKVEQ